MLLLLIWSRNVTPFMVLRVIISVALIRFLVFDASARVSAAYVNMLLPQVLYIFNLLSTAILVPPYYVSSAPLLNFWRLI